MDSLVALVADHQCFTLTGRHHLYPGWLFGFSRAMKILQVSDVVDLHLFL
jgi:hypothetical protein